MFAAAFALIWLGLGPVASAQVIIVGNDSKAQLVNGQLKVDAAAEQSLSIVDIGGYGPRVRATVPVLNSIIGPPTNLQVTPDDKLALVAEAMKVNEDNSKFVPSDKLHVIDLEANPPKVIDSVTVGLQPSGLSISPNGKLVLVANRGETSVSVLSIDGKKVTMLGKVDTKDQISHVVFFPDGKRAMINKASSNKVSFLAIDGTNVTVTGPEITVGWYPYNGDITPDGKLALVANTGNNGRSDGNEDSITVIDVEANPPRVIGVVSAGDAPEGITISPSGKLAVTGNLCGSDQAPEAWWYRKQGCINVFGIEGKKVTHLKEITVGGVPEALAFSPDGLWLLVGNLLDSDMSVFRVNGTQLTDTGTRMPLPGHPGAMRGRAR
jgi:DNA-binding beta-propeller fold protein YncE